MKKLILLFMLGFTSCQHASPTQTPVPTISPTPILVYYVAPQGSDSNPGTQSQPWKTIQKAADTATSGKTVLVLAGDYSTQQTNITRPGITIQAQGEVTVKGFQISADHITIKGFTIIDLDDNSVGIKVASGGWCNIENNNFRFNTMGGLDFDGSPTNPSLTHDCTVRNNIFYRNGQAGITVRGQNHLIEGNDISYTIQQDPCNITYANESWLDSDGIDFYGSGHIFRKNIIHDISYGLDGYTQGTTCNLANLSNLANDYEKDPHIDCFQTFGGNEVAGHDILFEDNTCNLPSFSAQYGLAAKGLQVEGGAYNLTFRDNIVISTLLARITDAHNVIIDNNTFVGLPNDPNSQGIYFYKTTQATVQNNIFAYQQNGVGSIFPDKPSAFTLNASFNCVFRNGGNPWRPKDPGDVWGLNPLFVNEASGDYHLQDGSPCIDKGTDLGPSMDFDGIPRPQGAGYDMGAYEYRNP